MGVGRIKRNLLTRIGGAFRSAGIAAAAIAACYAAPAAAQNEEAAASGQGRLGCLYEQLPTIAKLRFELAARVGGDAASQLVRGARAPAFFELIQRCGFPAEDAAVDLATRYWVARSTRMVSAIEADRAGVNVETLAIALMTTTPRETMAGLAEEMMKEGGEAAAEGDAGVAVLGALSAYEEVQGALADEPKRLAATFLASEIIMIGLEDGATPPGK